MIKKCLLLLPLITLLFFSCKKQEKPDAKFVLAATLQNSNNVSLSWPAFTLTGFKNITIYRSTTPIPDPSFDKSIDGNLIIQVITDNTITKVLDSNINVGSNGTVYYKAVINLSDRLIVSEQAQIELNAFSLVLPNGNNQFSNSFFIKRLPEANLLYVFNLTQSIISVIDYSQKKVLVSANLLIAQNSNYIFPCINNNATELFIYMNNSIICLDGITLTQKYAITPNASVSDFKIKNGFMYVLTTNYNVLTYNLSNQTLVGQFTYSSSSSIYSPDIFVGSQSNSLYLKYYTENETYIQGVGYVYSYKNMLMAYDISTGIPGLATSVNIAALNGDTTSNYNTYYSTSIQLSPSGKYITCNQNGDIYSFNDNSMHNIRSGNNFSPTPVFSTDDRYLLGKTLSSSSGITSNLIDVWSLPNFNLTTSLRSQNPTTALILDDFMDNDSLISYNISQIFIGNQTLNSLTVLFEKVD